MPLMSPSAKLPLRTSSEAAALSAWVSETRRALRPLPSLMILYWQSNSERGVLNGCGGSVVDGMVVVVVSRRYSLGEGLNAGILCSMILL